MNKEQETQPPPPRAYVEFKKRFPAVVEAYESLGKACHWQGPLDPKSRELIKLGIAIGSGMEGASRAHVRIAREAGATEDEIRHAALLATTTIGFPAMMRAMRWIDSELDRQ